MHQILGIDIGGTGIKSAIVDIEAGILLTSREKIATPKPATVHDVTKTLQSILKSHNWTGDVGIGFPGTIVGGKIRSANNLDESWKGLPVREHFCAQLGANVKVINDADAAGLAELYFGNAKGMPGSVVLLTIGTGIGSCVMVNGTLLEGSELGQMFMSNGLTAELFTSNRTRKVNNIEWMEWGKRLNIYLRHITEVFSPTYILLGGGASARPERFMEAIDKDIPVLMAKTQNTAGIIGAALSCRL